MSSVFVTHNNMIVLQWEEKGVSRLHLGILTRRQFDSSEQNLRSSPLAASVSWLIDDFRGSWIDSDLLEWLDRIAACVAAVAATRGMRRHAVVIASEMIQRLLPCLLRLDIASVWQSETTRLFDCPLKAKRWVTAEVQVADSIQETVSSKGGKDD
jgi:hypothetical protein